MTSQVLRLSYLPLLLPFASLPQMTSQVLRLSYLPLLLPFASLPQMTSQVLRLSYYQPLLPFAVPAPACLSGHQFSLQLFLFRCLLCLLPALAALPAAVLHRPVCPVPRQVLFQANRSFSVETCFPDRICQTDFPVKTVLFLPALLRF